MNWCKRAYAVSIVVVCLLCSSVIVGLSITPVIYIGYRLTKVM